jgi:hypothetical protein
MRRLLSFNAPNPVVYSYIGALCLLYTLVALHTPLTLYPTAMGDDGTFMLSGQYLSAGDWLGPFNSFTLMKGPGYPAFLAVANWLGMPVSFAQALFHSATIVVLVTIAQRFMKSYLLSGLLFALLLWHPYSLDVFGRRIVRERIYCEQMLLLFATMAAALFLEWPPKRRITWAAISGATLGWFWLTREEGASFVPAMVVLAAAAALVAWRAARVGEFAAALLVLIAVFAATQVGFRGVNWWAYGKFVGVDFKEANFQRALGAIHSVRSGGTKPFVSVTRAARDRIYDVSPSFASLKGYIESDEAVGYWDSNILDLGCRIHPNYPESCKEIQAGWFVWILRGGAATTGHYSSPTEASTFFGRVADEITAACANGALECAPQPIPEMPPFDWSQLAHQLPSLYLKAIRLLIPLDPHLDIPPSVGSGAVFKARLRFLNYPLYARSKNDPEAGDNYTFTGWYHNSGRDWITVAAKMPGGSAANVDIDRLESPDVSTSFKDPSASRQRFSIRTDCTDDCILTVEGSDGATLEKRLAELGNPPGSFNVGTGTFYIDSKTVLPDPTESPADRYFGRVRAAVLTAYPYIFLPTLFVGLLAFLAATFVSARKTAFNGCYTIALSWWLVVFLQVSSLSLIDAVAFPAVNGLYIGPAHFALVCAAVFSCAAWFQMSLREPDAPAEYVAQTESSGVNHKKRRLGRSRDGACGPGGGLRLLTILSARR